MAVMIGIAAEGHVELVAEINQAAHGIGRGTIHAYLSIPVERHEAERRIDGLIDDFEVETVAVGDGPPVFGTRSTQWVDPEREVCVADDVRVEDVLQIGDVSSPEIVAVCGRSPQGSA